MDFFRKLPERRDLPHGGQHDRRLANTRQETVYAINAVLEPKTLRQDRIG